MSWRLTENAEEFLAAAGDLLRRDRARNTILLTATELARARGGDGALFGHTDDGAFVHIPPRPVVLTDIRNGAAVSLARELASCGHEPVGVNAPAESAGAFAAEWEKLTGATARPFRSTRLFRLEEFTPPDPLPEGTPRVADSRDRDLIVGWSEAFASETGDLGRDHASAVDGDIARGGTTLWEVDGVTVSMASISPNVADMARVFAVYTPPEHRGRGYAGAVTSEVSRAALSAGIGEIVLFTDLANPVSNAIYPRLGYRPVQDRVVLVF